MRAVMFQSLSDRGNPKSPNLQLHLSKSGDILACLIWAVHDRLPTGIPFKYRDRADHINIRILHSASKGQYKGRPCYSPRIGSCPLGLTVILAVAHVVFWAPTMARPCSLHFDSAGPPRLHSMSAVGLSPETTKTTQLPPDRPFQYPTSRGHETFFFLLLCLFLLLLLLLNYCCGCDYICDCYCHCCRYCHCYCSRD